MFILRKNEKHFFLNKHRFLFKVNISLLGTLRYEDGKARVGTTVDVGNFLGSRCVAKNRMLKLCIFAKNCDVNNYNKLFPQELMSFRQ